MEYQVKIEREGGKWVITITGDHWLLDDLRREFEDGVGMAYVREIYPNEQVECIQLMKKHQDRKETDGTQ